MTTFTQPSEICLEIDLASNDSVAKGELFCHVQELRETRVKTVLLHCNGDEAADHFQTRTLKFAQVIKSLICLGPREVIIQMDHQELPVSALAAFLKSSHSVKSLTLNQVFLQGSTYDYQLLEKVLMKQARLVKLTIHQCRGHQIVQLLLTRLPALVEISISSSCITSQRGTTTQVLKHVCASPHLRALVLQDVPDLHEAAALAVTEALVASDTKLEKLDITSNSLGETTGEAITELMLINQTIRDLTLRLNGQWDNCGSAFASVFRANHTLSKVSILLYDESEAEVNARAIKIFEALKDNPHCTVEKLVLSLELDMLKDKQRVDPAVHEAIDNMLRNNCSLQELLLTDDGMSPIENSDAIQEKLALNRSGVPKFAQRHPPGSHFELDNEHSRLLTALISHKESLDILYFALSNDPSLVASFSSSGNAEANKQQYSSLDSDSLHSIGSSISRSISKRIKGIGSKGKKIGKYVLS